LKPELSPTTFIVRIWQLYFVAQIARK